MTDDDIWYRLGYTLERSRSRSLRGPLRAWADHGLGGVLGSSKDGGAEGGSPGSRPRRGSADDGEPDGESSLLSLILTAGAGTVAMRLLDLWPTRRRPGVRGMVRGALAGAGAAYLRSLLSPLLRGEVGVRPWDEDLPDELLEGAATGLVYAALLDGRLPGPPLARGAAFGAIEYAIAPWGGLEGVLGKHAPHRRIPIVRELLGPGDGEPEGGEPGDEAEEGVAGVIERYADETLVDHIAFAVALGLLYGETGIRLDEE